MVKFRHILHHHFCFGAIQYGLLLAPLCCGPFKALLFSPILTPGQQQATFLHTFRGGIGGRQNRSYCPNPINSILFPHPRSENCKFFTHLSKKNRKVCEQVEYARLRSAIRNFFTFLQKERSASTFCGPWRPIFFVSLTFPSCQYASSSSSISSCASSHTSDFYIFFHTPF